MKNIFLYIILVFSAITVHAQAYQPVDSRSQVKVVIKNVGMDTEGRLSGLQGSIRFNPVDLKSAVFDMSIDATSINTDIEPRDRALREAEYLDAIQHPRISFHSKQVTQMAGGKGYLLKGTLTIKGISKEISFPFTATPTADGMLFSGEMKLNRKDFRIATGSIVLAESFTVVLSVFASRS
jgi:polyisoprenoid-binding protein YceI